MEPAVAELERERYSTGVCTDERRTIPSSTVVRRCVPLGNDSESSVSDGSTSTSHKASSGNVLHAPTRSIKRLRRAGWVSVVLGGGWGRTSP